MDIISVQRRLSELGLLDPPATDVWNGTAAWALSVVMGGPVQTESVTSQAVEDKLKAAAPLPLSPGNDLAGLMTKAALTRGAWICRHPACFNLIYAEGTNLDGTGNGDPPNHFAALRTLIQIGVDGVPRFASVAGGGVAKWIATTEPSKYWTENPMNENGAARLLLGQQKAWTTGFYHGNPALIEAAQVRVQRDPDGTYKRYGPIYTGSFGIHHHADYNYPINNQGHSSAGCCVGWNGIQHRIFCSMEQGDPRFRANHGYLFMSTIVTHADIVAAKPALMAAAPSADAISRRCEDVQVEEISGVSAYTGEPIEVDEIGFSVSCKFAEPRPWVRCWNRAHNAKVEGPLVDVGPNDLADDPWWEDPAGQPVRGAGLGATAATCRALGLDSGRYKYSRRLVDFELIASPNRASWRPKST